MKFLNIYSNKELCWVSNQWIRQLMLWEGKGEEMTVLCGQKRPCEEIGIGTSRGC